MRPNTILFFLGLLVGIIFAIYLILKGVPPVPSYTPYAPLPFIASTPEKQRLARDLHLPPTSFCIVKMIAYPTRPIKTELEVPDLPRLRSGWIVAPQKLEKLPDGKYIWLLILTRSFCDTLQGQASFIGFQDFQSD